MKNKPQNSCILPKLTRSVRLFVLLGLPRIFGSVPVAHSNNWTHHLYRPVPRVTSMIDQSESPILNWPIGDVSDWAPPEFSALQFSALNSSIKPVSDYALNIKIEI
ncbi:unnamed protein product [Lasius platythorax]|uniref:Uncharacterized protein n=1 Tax=Lasius platythorax TaxID=488582 RepID=A0AAV2P382_9HYME